MKYLDAYSSDYFVARQRFREIALQHDAHLEQRLVLEPDLTIDIARFGSPDAKQLLIISSGLHGVEGPFGSAVQLAWMNSLAKDWQPPNDTSILLVHALNPYGYTYRRRFNEDNIDLNRNFLSPEQFVAFRKETEQSLYAKLDRYLNPPSPPGWIDWFPVIAIWLLLRYGKDRLRQTLPIGQYAFPKGLFFGGFEQAKTTRMVIDQFPQWIGNSQTIIHLDFHTGLGDWATYKLLLAEPNDSPRAKWAKSIFPIGIETQEGTTAYQSRGDMGILLTQLAQNRNYLCLTAEFGTYPNVQTLKKLRKENRACHFASKGSKIQQQSKEELLEAFVPHSSEWRTSVLTQSMEIIQSALNNYATFQ
jgi:hypothetical protein